MIEDAKVLLYLLAIEPAMTGMFKLVYEPLPTVDQLRARAQNKENSFLALRQQPQDPVITEILERLVRDAFLD